MNFILTKNVKKYVAGKNKCWKYSGFSLNFIIKSIPKSIQNKKSEIAQRVEQVTYTFLQRALSSNPGNREKQLSTMNSG